MKQDTFLTLENVLRKITHRVPVEWKKHVEMDITRTEVLVLYKLENEGQTRPSDIAKSLSVTTGGLTGITDNLVHLGYISRARDTIDRRVVYLNITDQGKGVLRKMYSARKDFIETLFSGITELEINQLQSILDKVARNIVPEDDANKNSGNSKG